MSYQSPQNRRIETARIVGIYALLGLAWIYGSDKVLGWLVSDHAVMVKFALIKGSFFIVCTATLLYFLISRFVQQLVDAERGQIESLKNYQSILNSAMDGFWLVSLQGRILEVNEAYCRMSGYSTQELLAMTIPDLEVHETASDAVAHNQKIMEQGEDRFVTQHRRKDGTVFDVEVSAKYIPVGAGLLVGFLRDITDRKLAEEVLWNERAFLRSLIDAATDLIYFKDRNSIYLGCNKASEAFTGLTEQEQRGRSDFDFFDREMAETILKHDQKVLQGGVAVRTEEWVTSKAGSRLLLDTVKAPIFGQDGQPIGLVGISRDITRVREQEKEQLKIEKLESLGILAGGIAHDFNNILTGIMGNISLAMMFIDPTHKSYNPLVGAEKASMRASELARQLLTFARGGEPVKKVLSLIQLAHESASLLLSGSNVKGAIDIPDSIHAIEADEGQISQVFNNSIINATQAMPGGGTLTISARNETLGDNNSLSLPPGPYVCLTFSDEGCGISDTNLKKIFDPYYTTKVSGSGLGLASLHSIVSRHGGHVSASSVVGKGTTLTIHLPSIGETFTAHLSEPDARPVTCHTGGSILVMDDDEIIRELLTDILTAIGYTVTTCENGADALALYRGAFESGNPFTAAIVDLTIPGGMGGREAAQEILAFDPTAKLIVSSGYSTDPIMSNHRAYGFIGVIAKPYKVDDLAHLLISL